MRHALIVAGMAVSNPAAQGPAQRRIGPCLTRRCRTSLSMRSAATCNSRKRWGRIVFARGLKPEPADSLRHGRSDARRNVQIAPDTFCRPPIATYC